MTAYLNENNTIRQAIEIFDYHKYSILPLIDDAGHYVGTLSEGDLLRFLKNDVKYDIKASEKIRIKDINRYREYKSLKVDSLLSEFFTLSLDQNFIPVIDDQNVYIGIIKRKEIIKYLSDRVELVYSKERESSDEL